MQQALTILIVLACTLWVARYAYRFFVPKPGGKACGGNCCDNSTPKKSATPEILIPSDALRSRLQARKG